jgi:hypothetical protein
MIDIYLKYQIILNKLVINNKIEDNSQIKLKCYNIKYNK